MATTQVDLIMEFFQQHPNRDIPTEEVVDWVTVEWERRKGTKFRDPDRAIRMLAQQGQLIKLKNGLYRYDPDLVQKRDDLTAKPCVANTTTSRRITVRPNPASACSFVCINAPSR